MKYDCGVIRDLLPLYHDKVCSEESSKMVEEHLDECKECQIVAEKINDDTYDKEWQQERENVVGKYTKKVRRQSFLVGTSIAGVLMIPVLVCLICNLAIGHSLDWFFIVLTSLIVFASVTVVPLMVTEKKGLWTLTGFTGSLLVLLLTCCIYVQGEWFVVTALSVLLGLCVPFLPYVMYQLPLPKALCNKKGLTVMIIDSLLLYSIVICATETGYVWESIQTTSVSIVLPWILFVIIRYLRTSAWIRAGISVGIVGIYTAFINDIITGIFYGKWSSTLKNVNLSKWDLSAELTVNANISCIILLSCVVIGIILVVIGILRGKKN